MRLMAAALLLWAALASAAENRAAAYARAVQEAGLDPEQCYRVRDLSFQKDELKFYLTEGHLIFTRPIDGKRLGAVFTTDVPGGDGEIIMFPPHRSERMSLATFAKTPNLNEHFNAAVFVFSDGTGEQLLEQIQTNPRKAPEVGALMASNFNDTIKNLTVSYQVRLVLDRFGGEESSAGIFFAAIVGRTLGNFDVVFDPRLHDQVNVGRLVYRGDRRFFDVWSSFTSRSFRLARRRMPAPVVTMREIAIDASIETDLSMKAVTRLTFTANEAGATALPFDISNRMRVTEAKFDGTPVELFLRESMRADLLRGDFGNGMFLVLLPQPLGKGETRTLEIAHEGNVVSSAGNGVYFVGARTNWYPNRDASFAPYRLTFRHPKALRLVATGELVSEKTEGEWRTVSHASSSPIRFAGFNLGDYDKTSLTRAGVSIDVYANRRIEAALQAKSRQQVILMPPPLAGRGSARRPTGQEVVTVTVPGPSPAVRLAELAAEVGGAMEYMASIFGPPPLKTLTVAPIPGAFGQGFPGLVYLSTMAYLDPADRPPSAQSDYERTFFSELLHAHETAHQWWGNLVTSGQYQDDWMMEALANYSALLYLEKKKGRRALESVLDEYRERLLSKNAEGKTPESAGPIVWGTRLNSSQSADAWRTVVYEKGAWILHMLRVRMGDGAFLKMLGELTRRYRYKALTTEDLRAIAAEFLPKSAEDPNLESFFEQWVYGTGVPTLKLKYEVQGKAPKVVVKGTVIQEGVDEDFSAAVPIEIQLSGRRAPVTHVVRTSSEPVPFTVTLKERPAKVALDPGNSVLARK